MITKNWYKIMTIVQGTIVTVGADTKIKNQFGNYINYTPTLNYLSYGFLPHNVPDAVYPKDGIKYAADQGTCFGTGGEQPTIDDIKLSGDCLNDKLKVICNNVVTVNEDCGTQKRVFTITNTSEEEINIREFGIFLRVIGSASTNYVFMVEHTLLDTPVTIAPNGVGQVEQTITVNVPTA